MRLICPNCDAQYEVDDSAIPESGRDVQCSNCGQTWFQDAAGKEEELAQGDAGQHGPESELAADSTPKPTPDSESQLKPDIEPDIVPAETEEAVEDISLKRQALDDAVLGILKEEAARETQARVGEGSSGLESQPDLGLPEGEIPRAPATPVQERTARLRGIEPEDVSDGSAKSRSDLLPDIEEINSTLSATSDRRGRGKSSDEAPDPSVVKRRRRGFRLGFGLVLMVVALLIITYTYSPQIIRTLPQSETAMRQYVILVDQSRDRLDGMMQSVIKRLRDQAEDGQN